MRNITLFEDEMIAVPMIKEGRKAWMLKEDCIAWVIEQLPYIIESDGSIDHLKLCPIKDVLRSFGEEFEYIQTRLESIWMSLQLMEDNSSICASATAEAKEVLADLEIALLGRPKHFDKYLRQEETRVLDEIESLLAYKVSDEVLEKSSMLTKIKDLVVNR